MRSLYSSLALAAFILSACAAATPQAVPVPSTPASTPIPLPTFTPLPQRAPVLRIAVLGEATTTNVWMIFDVPGADYWNYATQADYWPRLYYLAPPSLDLRPATAKGEPSPLVCDSATCTATVALQPGLVWTDGSPFTADDVAFTVNTALQFRLGLNWQRAYNPDILDHAEALDKSTVRFYFHGKPSVANWQYGVLQGPVVNKTYWQPRLLTVTGMLPDESLLPTIQKLEQDFAEMQARVDEVNLALDAMAPNTLAYDNTKKTARRYQDELNSIANKIEKSRTEYETRLAEARTSLFALPNANEPTLGPWLFASRVDNSFENQVNLGTPFGNPWFDRVHYLSYPNEMAAVRALRDNEVDLILTPDGLSAEAVSQLEGVAGITLRRNPTRSARFLVFNHARPYLNDPALHQALACVIDLQALTEEIEPLPGFVVDAFWLNPDASLPCTGLGTDARYTKAVDILKAAGYSWINEPENDKVGLGLSDPRGKTLPSFRLLVPPPVQDALRAAVADAIVKQAGLLGVILNVQPTDHDEMLYAVYGSGDYDLALLGWRLGAYPAYLCDWFMPVGQNPFAYNESSLGAACEAWGQTDSLEQAKVQAFEIQSLISQDLPLIPLYSIVRLDAYRNVSYPFTDMVDGLGGLYGAPALAISR